MSFDQSAVFAFMSSTAFFTASAASVLHASCSRISLISQNNIVQLTQRSVYSVQFPALCQQVSSLGSKAPNLWLRRSGIPVT